MPKPRKNEADRLDDYRAKRSADRTTEPFGGYRYGEDTPVGQPRLFVCQMHAARRLHWDLRLEIDGVLRSWAVPRGPSPDPAEKRLAVETEDHPLEYVDFEGVIPQGNYGAGAMIVWDRGVWIPLEPVAPGYAKGKLLFELQGHKLRGVWTLARTKGDAGREWLLIKKPDAAATTDPRLDDASVLSGLTIDDLRRGVDRSRDVRARLAALGAPRRRVDPATVEVMKAEAREEPFTREGWVFELKYDGYRLVAARRGDEVTLRYRSGRNATDAFPEITRTLRALPFADFVLDGEVVVLDPDAKPNFQRLQKRAQLLRGRDVDRAMREHPVTLYAFDLLGFEDFDLRPLPLVERKALLRSMLPATGAVRFADHVPTQGERLFQEVRKLGVEGIVGKLARSPYRAGRSSEWIKVRTERSDDFVIVGFTEPEGTRPGFGALHLASHRRGVLTYMGRVGSGFDEKMLVELRRILDRLVRKTPPCQGAVPTGRKHTWVEPELVCEVRFKHVTDGGFLRHPVLSRLREDKTPAECEIEPSEPDGADHDDGAPPDDPPPESSSATTRVAITNPDKIFWPAERYTKADLVDFYRRIAPWLLEYLRDRPLVLTRYPDGIEGKSFFQKNAPEYVPSWLRTQTMWSEHARREIQYFLCDDVDALVYVANLATIPLHIWGSRLSDLQHPDWCILDLDPKTAPFAHVVRIARRIHDLCQEIGLPAYAKTSGSTGLHVLVPLGRACTFEQCRMLGEVLARVTAQTLPDIATVERSVRARQGRVYIDFLQNGHGRLLAAPFCVRPLPGAPVSTPLSWDEVGDGLDPSAFTIRSVLQRMERLGTDPMAPVLRDRPDLQQVLTALLARLA